MTPLHLAVLALVLLWSLLAYGTRAVVVLALGSLAVLLVDPADVPSVLRAILARF